MEQMMNFEQEDNIKPEKVEDSNIDDLMLNFGTGLNMDMEFSNSNVDMGIGSNGINLFQPVNF